MRWVRQEDEFGCGIAILAMLTDRTYIDVKYELLSDPFASTQPWKTNGFAHPTVEYFLTKHGHYTQTVYKAWNLTTWPPEPWAMRHYANVVQPSGNAHWVVMNRLGWVYDPMVERRRKLTDFPSVNSVTALNVEV
jgi:hypothetical protein